jgi:hypothetical protein
MVHKKRLTRAKPSPMVRSMKARVASQSQNRNTSVIILKGVKFRILPEKEYEGMVATMEINSNPEMSRKMKEAFDDPDKMIFDSVEEMEKYLDSDADDEEK